MKYYVVSFHYDGYPFYLSKNSNPKNEYDNYNSYMNVQFAERFYTKEAAMLALKEYLDRRTPSIKHKYIHEVSEIVSG